MPRRKPRGSGGAPAHVLHQPGLVACTVLLLDTSILLTVSSLWLVLSFVVGAAAAIVLGWCLHKVRSQNNV